MLWLFKESLKQELYLITVLCSRVYFSFSSDTLVSVIFPAENSYGRETDSYEIS